MATPSVPTPPRSARCSRGAAAATSQPRVPPPTDVRLRPRVLPLRPPLPAAGRGSRSRRFAAGGSSARATASSRPPGPRASSASWTTSPSCSSPPPAAPPSRRGARRASAAATWARTGGISGSSGRRSGSGNDAAPRDRSRPLLRGGRFFRGSLGRRGPRGGHPCPWRPRRLGLPRLPHGRSPACSASSASAWTRRPGSAARRTAPRSTSAASASRSTPPVTFSAPPRYASSTRARSGSSRATTRPSPIPPARRSSRCAATPSSPSPPSACPIYRWPPAASVFDEIHAWWRANQAAGKASLLFGYALGKAQRLIAGLDPGSRADPHPRRRGAADARLPRGRRAAPADDARGGVGSRVVAARHRHRATLADGSVWARRFGAAVHGIRLGLDGGARNAAAARRRPRLHDLRSRRLAQPARRHRCHRRRARLGDARLHRRAGALAARARTRRAGGRDPLRGRAGRRDGRGGGATSRRHDGGPPR